MNQQRKTNTDVEHLFQTSKFKVRLRMKIFMYHLLMAHPVSIASNNQANFGTTVTVIVSKKEPNLKSSLKKPKGAKYLGFFSPLVPSKSEKNILVLLSLYIF